MTRVPVTLIGLALLLMLNAPLTASGPPSADPGVPRVLEVVRRDAGLKVVPRDIPDRAGEPDFTRASLGDDLLVTVDHLDTLVAKDPQHRLVLYLDGIALTGVYAQRTAADQLLFTLRRTESNKQALVAVLGKPDLVHSLFNDDRALRSFALSVGYEGDRPIETKVAGGRFRLQIIDPGWYWGCIVGFAIMLLLLVWRAPEMLREADAGSRYSLGRVQMAWWTMLILGSFLFLWLVTGATNTISAAAVGLLGISAATFVGAAAIDTRPATPPPDDHPPAAPRPPGSWLPRIFADILHDDDGIGLHRFQLVIWTLVLGIVFLAGVYRDLAMPELDATLLGLMGISSGAYLGFKFPEKRGAT